MASNCDCPEVLSTESEDKDLAGDTGRFALKGLKDLRNEGDCGLFKSDNIGSEAESLFCDCADSGRRVAAMPEPLLPSNGERGCLSRGDMGACPEILSLRRASFVSSDNEILALADDPLLRCRIGELEGEVETAEDPLRRREGEVGHPSVFPCSPFNCNNSIAADPRLLEFSDADNVSFLSSSPSAAADASCVDPRLLISAELFAN